MAIGRISFDKNGIRNVGCVIGTWPWLQRCILAACALCIPGKSKLFSSRLHGPSQKHFQATKILDPHMLLAMQKTQDWTIEESAQRRS